jgi:excisionase family DNA binding protein
MAILVCPHAQSINRIAEIEMEILAHTLHGASARANVGRTILYKAINDGELRAVKRGKRTLILDEDLRQWVHSWPQLEPAKRDDPINVPKPAQPAKAAIKARKRDRSSDSGRRSAAPTSLPGAGNAKRDSAT